MRRAWFISLDNKQAMPKLISSRRPAAFKRGANEKPKSLALKRAALRFATSIRALIPGRVLPLRIRAKP